MNNIGQLDRRLHLDDESEEINYPEPKHKFNFNKLPLKKDYERSFNEKIHEFNKFSEEKQKFRKNINVNAIENDLHSFSGLNRGYKKLSENKPIEKVYIKRKKKKK